MTHTGSLENTAPATQSDSRRESFVLFSLFLGANLFLGTLFIQFSLITTLHALLTFLFGVHAALLRRDESALVYTVAYIVGAEVAWRMGGARIPWESGKYFVTVLLLLSLLRRQRFTPKFLPLAYFLLLLPSIAVLFEHEIPFWTIKDYLSFNLSGPLCLAVTAFYFKGIELERDELINVLACFVAGACLVLAGALFSTLNASDLVFIQESNFVTSGGFGPNQVSSTLGFGVLCAFWLAFLVRDFHVLLLSIAMATLFLTQSLLTFSRGGTFAAIIAIALAVAILYFEPRLRHKAITVTVFCTILFTLIIVPRLNSFTGGALEKRYSETRPSDREELIELQIEIWKDHPLLGVGPGMSRTYLIDKGRAASSHTEFSRLPAEHGLLGALSLVALFTMCALNILRRRSPLQMAIFASLIAFASLLMLTAAMRISIGAFLIGFAFIDLGKILPPPKPPPESPNP